MGLLHSLQSALGVVLRRQRFEDGLSDELRFHIDAYAEDLVRSGVSPEDAQRRARLEFGSTESLKEELRAARGQRLFDELWQDIRYAGRRLRRARVPAVVAVLALGVGVNLAVFSVIHASIVRPLPHPEPDRLVSISSRNIESGREHLMAPLDFFDIESRAASFARIAAYYPPGFTLTGGEQAERVSGARASSGIFEVFGVQPALGRGFLPAEDRAGAPPVAVISHALWMRRYQGDPGVLGQPIVLSGRPYTLVGVLPEGFHSPAMWPRMPEVWVPLGLDPNVGRRDARMLRVLGRLRPGRHGRPGARRARRAIASALATEHPDTNTGTGAAVAGLLEQLTRDVRPSLYALAAAVARAAARRLRQRGGAARRRSARAAARVRHAARARRQPRADRPQIVAENLVRRVCIAAVAGFALALWTSDFLVGAADRGRRAAGRGDPRRFPDVRVRRRSSRSPARRCARWSAGVEATRARDLRVVPRRPQLDAAPQPGPSRRSSASRPRSRWPCSSALALLIRSFYALQLTNPGFESAQHPDDAALGASGPISCGTQVWPASTTASLERVKALPGVEAASVVDWLPASGFGASVWRSAAPGAAPQSQAALAELRVIGLDYFRTLGIPLVAGRSFDRRDVERRPARSSPSIDSLARAYFGSEDPIGKRLTLDRGRPLEVEIVGVVGDVRELALRLPPGPGIYAPNTQQPWIRHETRDLVIRTAADTAALAPAIYARAARTRTGHPALAGATDGGGHRRSTDASRLLRGGGRELRADRRACSPASASTER